MIDLVEKHNDIMNTVDTCKLLIRICIQQGAISCSTFCKHYEAINRNDYTLCPAELKRGTTDVCATEILQTAKENPEKFKKMLREPLLSKAVSLETQ